MSTLPPANSRVDFSSFKIEPKWFGCATYKTNGRPLGILVLSEAFARASDFAEARRERPPKEDFVGEASTGEIRS